MTTIEELIQDRAKIMVSEGCHPIVAKILATEAVEKSHREKLRLVDKSKEETPTDLMMRATEQRVKESGQSFATCFGEVAGNYPHIYEGYIRESEIKGNNS